eukprot:470459_1
MGCPFSTQSGTVRIIETFGKYSHTATAGLNILLCPCLCYQNIAGTISLRLQEIRVKCETKTKDNVFVVVQISVQYQVKLDKIEEAHYRLSNATEQIEAYVYDVVRSEVPKATLDNLFILKEELSLRVKQQLKENMESFGYEIIATPVTDIDPDIKVKQAMNEINRQERLKLAATEEAEARKIIMIKDAEAKAQKIIIEATAEADAKELQGQGLARQRQAIIDGLQESVKIFKQGLPGADTSTVMDLILLTQYFDTLKDIGSTSSCNTLFIPSDPGHVKTLAAQFRQGILEGTSALKGGKNQIVPINK